ncbi:MAG: Na+/H+ antiporter NhaC family protein, partial [Bacteroidetes bacterium]|nr:Na+/H+ antiporter NhaC family protein [Bacteroidota bacterium]
MATWFLGIAIFFDDYANTLIVGNTMRPITDKLKISREKLAYLVDSTAAPVAAIGFITTWIGSELVYIKDGISKIPNGANLFGSEYSVFISSLQFMFYPILTLIFMFFLIWKGRDFGPMLKAEQNARKIETSGIENAKVGEIDQIPDNKEFVLNGLLPILTLVVTVGLSLYFTGKFALKNADNASLSDIIGNADSYKALVWGSFLGLVSAILLTVSTKVLSIEKTMNYVLEGFKSMIPAIVILALAWTLGSLTEQLGTAEYLAQITEGNILPQLLPTIVFILAGLIAFSTGTSWGTMAILYPMVLFTSWKICIDSGISQDLSLFVFANVVSAVLAGSVL